MPTFRPLHPDPKPIRPISQGATAFRNPYHPLFSAGGQNLVRAQFSITDWLLIGCGLQALILLISPFPIAWSLAPTFVLITLKLSRTIAISYGLITNPHMKDVRVGRQSAVFPNEEGGFERKVGESVGGKGMCIILLSAKCNHPLGILHPGYAALTKYGKQMYIDLERNPEEYGFLGYSSYFSADTVTKPFLMQIMYFRSVEHLHKFAHQSKAHREGWDWWNAKVAELDEVTIAHEVYSIPDGGWENINHNSYPHDFAATSHAIKAEGGERMYLCPLVDANKGFKSGAVRMDTVKI